MIDIGSRVEVRWANYPSIRGVVKHVPSATGDSWVIYGRESGKSDLKEFYLGCFACMVELLQEEDR